MSWLFYI